MAKSRANAFDRYVDERMRDPEFKSAYKEARARIDAVDRIVRSLDAVREERGWSKAELARRIGTRPETVRRLFTAASPNPTLDTFVALARALGLRILIEGDKPKGRSVKKPSSRARKVYAAV